jgi:hypothetical protein
VHGVLGLPTVPQDLKSKAVERGSVTFEQEPKAGDVALLGYPNELRITQHLTCSFCWLHYERHVRRTHQASKKFEKGEKFFEALCLEKRRRYGALVLVMVIFRFHFDTLRIPVSEKTSSRQFVNKGNLPSGSRYKFHVPST